MPNRLIDIYNEDGEYVNTRQLTDEEETALQRHEIEMAKRLEWRIENENKFATQKEFAEAYTKHFGLDKGLSMKANRIPIRSPLGIHYIGSTQHRIICDMMRYGKGLWKFHATTDQKKALEVLATRMLVEKFAYVDENSIHRVGYRLVPGIEIMKEEYGGEGLVKKKQQMIIGHIHLHEPTGRQAICGGYGLCNWCTEAQK